MSTPVEAGIQVTTYRVSGRVVEMPTEIVNRMRGPWPPADYESNGCSPPMVYAGENPFMIWSARWWNRMRLRLVPQNYRGVLVELACHCHDFVYAVGGTWADRRIGDLNFWFNILELCLYVGMHPLRSALIATCYWIAVRIFGWRAFNYAEGEEPESRWQLVREALLLFSRNP